MSLDMAVLLFLFGQAGAPAPAVAPEPAANGTINLKDGKCSVDNVTPSHAKTVKVHVNLPEAAKTVSLLGVKVNGPGKAFDMTLTREAAAKVVDGKFKLDVTLVKGDAPVSFACETEKVFFATDAGETPKGAGSEAPEVKSAGDKDVQDWWMAKGDRGGAAELERVRMFGEEHGLPSDTKFVVHKPLGNLIYPTSAALTEGTPVQVAILLPHGEAGLVPSIRFDDCDGPDPQRVVPQSSSAPAARQGATYDLHMLGPWRSCGAGKLTYHLAYSGGQQVDTTLRVRPKYHFAGIALLGYDLAKRTSFEKASDATGTTTSIAEVDSRVGAIAYVGAQWMVGGVDYEAMKPWNYFLNPFLAVNVAAPLSDAVVGLALTPTGGASVAIGASFHSSKRLKNGATVGQTFTGNGDVPTDDTWNGVKPGLFVGLAIDTRVADALSSRFKGGTAGDKAKDAASSKPTDPAKPATK